MDDRLSEYDEKVLRRLIQIETDNRASGKKEPLAFIKRDTEAGAAMRRLDQLGFAGVTYRDGNPLVIEVLGKGYSYVANLDVEREDVERMERYRKEDKRHDYLISVLTAVIAIVGTCLGFLLGHVI